MLHRQWTLTHSLTHSEMAIFFISPTRWHIGKREWVSTCVCEWVSVYVRVWVSECVYVRDRLSEWVRNDKWAIFQLYNGDNKLWLNALYTRPNTLSLVNILSASSLKEQSADRHDVAPLRHIILIPSQLDFALFPQCWNGEQLSERCYFNQIDNMFVCLFDGV